MLYMSRIILGIDPGFAILGWGIIESNGGGRRIENVQWGAILTKSGEPIENRLLKIYQELKVIIDLYNPNEIALEKVFFNNNAKTIIGVAQVQGLVFLLSAIMDIPIFQYTPLQAKNALTGYGVANKQQVQNMLKLILKLEDFPRPDDAADAVALAFCHLQTRKYL